MPPENLFAGAYLDRRAEARLRDDWLAEARGDSGTLYMVSRQGTTLIRSADGADGSRIAFLAGNDPRVAQASNPERSVLLGWYQERRCVLVEIDESPAMEQPGEVFAELRPLVTELAAPEASLVAYARALSLWRANHLHCGRCGARTAAVRAGHARQCGGCGHESFPRLDPAIIVLAHDGQRALLGRQATWPPNRYSTLAGFVEPGESLEDAVRREVHEEAGIRVSDVSYHSSQPWPFPSSLMLGFIARAEHATPTLHDSELEDARWVSREQIRAGAVLLPPAHAISRRLIDHWLDHDE
jgi:NAD+ diphosphatase